MKKVFRVSFSCSDDEQLYSVVDVMAKDASDAINKASKRAKGEVKIYPSAVEMLSDKVVG